MSYLEELLPEFRKGAKIRRRKWIPNAYIYKDGSSGFCFTDESKQYNFTHEDIVLGEWELYQYPDWDYIIKNKCLCWFWDEHSEEMKMAGILADYDYDNSQFRRCIGDKCALSWFDYCRPVRRDEVTFYEDRKDE